MYLVPSTWKQNATQQTCRKQTQGDSQKTINRNQPRTNQPPQQQAADHATTMGDDENDYDVQYNNQDGRPRREKKQTRENTSLAVYYLPRDFIIIYGVEKKVSVLRLNTKLIYISYKVRSVDSVLYQRSTAAGAGTYCYRCS